MPGRKPGPSPMKQLNLDDYGNGSFAERRRRNDVCQKRFQMAQSAFMEAAKIRLAGWWKHQAEERGESQWGYRYSQRKVFTAIDNDGRSYGWISGMGGQGELVWSPDEPPIFFK